LNRIGARKRGPYTQDEAEDEGGDATRVILKKFEALNVKGSVVENRANNQCSKPTYFLTFRHMFLHNMPPRSCMLPFPVGLASRELRCTFRKQFFYFRFQLFAENLNLIGCTGVLSLQRNWNLPFLPK
jgi:hypothetical protein